VPGKGEACVAEHDRQIAAVRKLVLTGMKMLARSDKNLLQLEGEQTRRGRNSANLRETDRMLKGLIRSLERGSNGHIRLG